MREGAGRLRDRQNRVDGGPHIRHSGPRAGIQEGGRGVDCATGRTELTAAPTSVIPAHEPESRREGGGRLRDRQNRVDGGPHIRHSGPRAGIQEGGRGVDCATGRTELTAAHTSVIPAHEPESRREGGGRLCDRQNRVDGGPRIRHSGPRAGIQEGGRGVDCATGRTELTAAPASVIPAPEPESRRAAGIDCATGRRSPGFRQRA